jgi:NTE family protein
VEGIPRRRLALVIGSGSVKCGAALGVQRVLAREGIPIDMVVGCSAESIYASLIAAGRDPESIAETMRRLWTREITSKRNRKAMLQLLFPKLFGFDEEFGLIDDTLAMKRLREGLSGLGFESMHIPLFITATDLMNGEQVTMSSGDLVTAIRASIAMPFAFAPIRVDGRLLTDGYLSDPLPVGVAIREGADVILAIGFESPGQTRIRSGGRFLFQVSAVMTNNLLLSNFAFHNLAHHTEVMPILPRFSERVGLFSTDKLDYVMREGERVLEEQLPYLRRMLAAPAVTPPSA